MAILLLVVSPTFWAAAQVKTPNPSAQAQIRVNPKDNLTYVWIRPGTYQMGCSPNDSQCSQYEKPAHSVVISQGFWIGQTPVTQAAYKSVIGANPSHFIGDRLPVESVTWDEAQSYCEQVNMRLPSEAEWEYAARGGSKSARYGPIERIAWYRANSAHTTHPVALKNPNTYGLYDTLGNVDEWVADLYGLYDVTLTPQPALGYKDVPPSDVNVTEPPQLCDPLGILGCVPTPPKSLAGPTSPALLMGTSRVVRGASWDNDAYLVSASNRMRYEPSARHQNVGFRCVGN
jgi:formylglycine-generating enzyme required for sulfatase activity